MAKIEKPDAPASYYLDANGGTVDIYVHKSIAPGPNDFDLERINGSYRGFIQVPGTFRPPSSDRGWGYGDVLTEYDGPQADWIRLACPLPSFTDQGTDWDGQINTVATLKFLFDYFIFTKKISKADIPQLLLVSMVQGQRYDVGAPIGADIKPPLSKWLEGIISSAVEQQTQQPITQAMFDAYSRMITEQQDPAGFSTEIFPPYYIRLQTPKMIQEGSLNPENQLPNGGYELVPHNVDRSLQQLSFLAGLSKLSFLATQGYTGTSE